MTNMTTLKIISFVFLILFPLFEAACYLHLYWNRNDILIRKRNKCAIYITSSAGWLAYLNLIISISGGVPCGVFYVVSLAIAPMAVGPQIIRALTLRGTLKYSELVTEEEMSSRIQRKKQLSTIHSDESEDQSSSPQLLMEANAIMERTRRVVMMVKWALLVIPAVLLILALALSSDASQLTSTDFDKCQPEPIYFQYASPTFGVAATALALMVTILAKEIDDEIGLRREIRRNTIFLGFSYVVIIAVRLSGYFDWQPLLQTVQQMMLSFSMLIMPFIPGSRLESIESWAEAQKKRINPATKSAVPGYAHPLPKGRSSIISTRGSTRTSIKNALGRRHSMSSAMLNDQRDHEVNVSWNAGLCILLSTEEGIKLFSQHCAREFSAENVRFWCAVNDYKAKFDEENCIPSPSSDASDERSAHAVIPPKNEEKFDMNALAKEIYMNFIDHPSNTQVNLSFKMRSDIKKVIDSGQCKRESFEAAQKEIFAVMSRDSYPRFLASKKNRQTVI